MDIKTKFGISEGNGNRNYLYFLHKNELYCEEIQAVRVIKPSTYVYKIDSKEEYAFELGSDKIVWVPQYRCFKTKKEFIESFDKN